MGPQLLGVKVGGVERNSSPMKSNRLLIPILLSSLIVQVASCQSDERTKGWNNDLDFYIAAVKRDHYVYRSKELPESFRTLALDLRNKISVYSDQRMLMEFERLAAQLGDGHTYILPWAAERVASQSLPVRFYLFSDGLFIIDALEPYKNLIGSRVDFFGAVSAKDAMTRIGDYVSRDNEMGIQWIGPVFLMLRGAWEVLGAQGTDAELKITDKSGTSRSVKLPFGPVPRMRGLPKLIASNISINPQPMYLTRVQSNYWITSLPAPVKTLYVQFNQVWDDPTESLAAFSKRLGDSLRKVKPLHLIIDVRHNNGGNAMLLDPLLTEMKTFRDIPGTRTTIITGRNTFSACQIFISRADALVHPVFAGERSSSKPNFVGEEHEVVLPYSGARGSISNRYHESIPGDNRQWIEPSMPVALTSADYFANRDPVLEAVIGDQ